ncbi:MAG: hypothetical protein PHH70_01965 [Candidatus Gracilibacteria bacterium]|nr:hypothetical protein [Candidatus Gracilibacteria bacterium]
MKQFISWVGKRVASALVTAVFFILAVIGIVYASVTFPSTGPGGVDAGGKFMTYFNNIFQDCGAGNVLQGFDTNKQKICVATTVSPTPAPAPTPTSVCIPDGSCSASAPSCETTTTGVDNCGASCTKTGPACTAPTPTPPVSVHVPTHGSYTYSAWSACSANCGGTQTRTELCNYDSCDNPQATTQGCNTSGTVVGGSSCTPYPGVYPPTCGGEGVYASTWVGWGDCTGAANSYTQGGTTNTCTCP